jgi:hypothetical protein
MVIFKKSVAVTLLLAGATIATIPSESYAQDIDETYFEEENEEYGEGERKRVRSMEGEGTGNGEMIRERERKEEHSDRSYNRSERGYERSERVDRPNRPSRSGGGRRGGR